LKERADFILQPFTLYSAKGLFVKPKPGNGAKVSENFSLSCTNLGFSRKTCIVLYGGEWYNEKYPPAGPSHKATGCSHKPF
jgi:hypothetical protein